MWFDEKIGGPTSSTTTTTTAIQMEISQAKNNKKQKWVGAVADGEQIRMIFILFASVAFEIIPVDFELCEAIINLWQFDSKRKLFSISCRMREPKRRDFDLQFRWVFQLGTFHLVPQLLLHGQWPKLESVEEKIDWAAVRNATICYRFCLLGSFSFVYLFCEWIK